MNLIRSGDASHLPSGIDNFASGPATLTTVSIQLVFSRVPASSCKRRWDLFGMNQFSNAMLPTVTSTNINTP